MSYDPNQPQPPDSGQQPQSPFGQPQPPNQQPQPPYDGQQWGQQPPQGYGQPGQPQQPPYGQQWGQQPPQGYAPTQYVAPAYGTQGASGYMPPQQPKRSRRGLWIVLGIIVGLIVLCCAVFGILFVAGVSFFAKTVAGPAIVADQYYSAIKVQDYNTAYSYIDSGSTVFHGQTLTLQTFTLAAQALDLAKGKVSSFSIGAPSVINNTGSITVTVNRTNAPTYDVQLQLQQVNGTWKITSFDNI